MAWKTLSEEQVRTRLSGPELAALRTAALAAGQEDPLPEVIAQVTGEVRGYVAACSANRLGPAGTIPPQLESAALALIRYRLAGRLPVRTLMTDDRRTEREAAERLLRDVAACKFAVEAPADAGPEKLPSPRPSIRPKPTPEALP